MKITITAAERLQLMGLLTMAAHHNKWLTDIKASTLALLGIDEATEPDFNRPSDHISDAVYSDYDADELLKRIGVTVDAGSAVAAVDPQGDSKRVKT